MRLIDADVFKKNMDYVCDAGGWLEPVTTAVTEYVKRHIDAQTTVDAIPVSFIKEQIEKLQGLADYEFIESGGYLGECNHELRALQDLLKHWTEREEE